MSKIDEERLKYLYAEIQRLYSKTMEKINDKDRAILENLWRSKGSLVKNTTKPEAGSLKKYGGGYYTNGSPEGDSLGRIECSTMAVKKLQRIGMLVEVYEGIVLSPAGRAYAEREVMLKQDVMPLIEHDELAISDEMARCLAAMKRTQATRLVREGGDWAMDDTLENIRFTTQTVRGLVSRKLARWDYIRTFADLTPFAKSLIDIR